MLIFGDVADDSEEGSSEIPDLRHHTPRGAWFEEQEEKALCERMRPKQAEEARAFTDQPDPGDTVRATRQGR